VKVFRYERDKVGEGGFEVRQLVRPVCVGVREMSCTSNRGRHGTAVHVHSRNTNLYPDHNLTRNTMEHDILQKGYYCEEYCAFFVKPRRVFYSASITKHGKVHPCTGTEALYRPYGP
jgi:hypothetical protein